MKPIDLIAAPSAEVVKTYRETALAHAKATGEGRHRVANRNYELLTALARELSSRDAVAKQALLDMLQDGELAVRVWAATHTLKMAAPQAERVLEDAASGPPSPVRLAAEMTLREWKAGRL